MSECNCNNYDHLDGRPALNKRGHDTKKIIDRLSLITEHAEGEHKLYQCPICGQFWQRSLDWMRGNKPYIFKVPVTTTSEWLLKPFVQPDDLFNRVAGIQQYLERASFVEQPEKCRKEGCTNRAINLSVLCAFHHMESIGLKSDVRDDFIWFEPYSKSNYEFTIDQLKKLPNYKAL